MTFQLSRSVCETIRAVVTAGGAPSANALVESAVTDKLRALRRERLYDEYRRAAEDPAFRADMDDVTKAFDCATQDGLGHQ